MNMLRTLILGLACSVPVLADAQWQWIETDGRKVFSDQPPPPHIPAASILKQPSARPQPASSKRKEAAVTPASTASAAAPPGAPAAPKITGKDQELEERKKQADAAAAEKLRLEKEKFEKVRAENCARAKSAKADYDSGARLARTNAKGEREIMDDATRAAEVRRLEGILANECKAS